MLYTVNMRLWVLWDWKGWTPRSNPPPFLNTQHSRSIAIKHNTSFFSQKNCWVAHWCWIKYPGQNWLFSPPRSILGDLTLSGPCCLFCGRDEAVWLRSCQLDYTWGCLLDPYSSLMFYNLHRLYLYICHHKLYILYTLNQWSKDCVYVCDGVIVCCTPSRHILIFDIELFFWKKLNWLQ